MTIKLVVSLGIFSYFADYSSINKLFDIIIPIYTILVLVVLLLFATFKPEEVSDEPVDIDLETPIRKAQLANAAPAKPVPEWKLKFFGTWDKLERTGFYDVSILGLILKKNFFMYLYIYKKFTIYLSILNLI